MAQQCLEQLAKLIVKRQQMSYTCINKQPCWAMFQFQFKFTNAYKDEMRTISLKIRIFVCVTYQFCKIKTNWNLMQQRYNVTIKIRWQLSVYQLSWLIGFGQAKWYPIVKWKCFEFYTYPDTAGTNEKHLD